MKILLDSSFDAQVLELRVTYFNDEMDARKVKFRNPEKTIAPGRLLVRDLNLGKVVEPIEFQIVSPLSDGIEFTLAPNGGSKSISLQCRIEGRFVRLPNETYWLSPEISYGIQVLHGGDRSNEIRFSLSDSE
jgi:hypothetical protein